MYSCESLNAHCRCPPTWRQSMEMFMWTCVACTSTEAMAAQRRPSRTKVWAFNSTPRASSCTSCHVHSAQWKVGRKIGKWMRGEALCIVLLCYYEFIWSLLTSRPSYTVGWLSSGGHRSVEGRFCEGSSRRDSLRARLMYTGRGGQAGQKKRSPEIGAAQPLWWKVSREVDNEDGALRPPPHSEERVGKSKADNDFSFRAEVTAPPPTQKGWDSLAESLNKVPPFTEKAEAAKTGLILWSGPRTGFCPEENAEHTSDVHRQAMHVDSRL